jgi:hypothetical protein
MSFSIKELDEWSIFHNKTIKVLNKPKRAANNNGAFSMSNNERCF